MANLRSFQLPPELSEQNDDQRHTQTRIRIRIPQQYHQEPVISNLITQHQLTVTITAALLGANAEGDGWFDLQLQGSTAQIRAALLYINDLDLEIWCDSNAQDESW
jgi:ABC-type methionine transport system ATPase subunit